MYAQHANANRPAQCSPCEGPYANAPRIASGLADSCKADAPRESHVPEEIGLLCGSVGSLVETVDNLLNRLSPVLAPVPTDPTGSDELDTYRVPVADDIRRQRRVVQGQVARLQEALRALEL